MQVFIPVDNDGHKFLFVADLKRSSVLLIDHHKKEKIVKKIKNNKIGRCDDVTVATMLVRIIIMSDELVH